MRAVAALVPLALGLAVAPAAADDAYCDYVKGVAAAEAALGFAPSVFASAGYVDAPNTDGAGATTGNDTRFTAGVAYRLTGLYEGVQTRARADAACARHQALADVHGATTARALAAKARVLDQAVDETEAMLARAADDLAARRATAPEIMAIRLRVNDLRTLAAETRRALDQLPTPGDGSIDGALARYHRADADVERREAALRRARGLDLSVRVGYDSFAAREEDDVPYFAVVSASVNLGVLFQFGGNARAASGRRRLVQTQRSGGPDDTTGERLRALLDSETTRAADTGALVDELEQQLEQLRGVAGDASRRIAQTVWFDLARVRAEHAYLRAHVAALRDVLGEGER